MVLVIAHGPSSNDFQFETSVQVPRASVSSGDCGKIKERFNCCSSHEKRKYVGAGDP